MVSLERRSPFVDFKAYNAVIDQQGGWIAFSSQGSDPQLEILDEDNKFLQLKKGMYRFLFQARISKGTMNRPKLYLDFGMGYAETEEQTAYLTRYDDDVWAVDFVLNKPVTKLRFDPSESVVDFTLLRLEVEVYTGYAMKSILGVAGLANARKKMFYMDPVSKKEPALYKLFKKHHVTNARYDVCQDLEEAAPEETFQPKALEQGSYFDNYRSMVHVAHGSTSPHFAPDKINETLVDEDDAKIIAFYLPQYHPFKENNEWWGKGFTEWTNVSKAVPQFIGHNQPRLPGELGFYDLRVPEVFQRQAELAKKYGVSAFCFHYYWFDGHRLMERPIDMYLENKDNQFDFPFCLCWANENWTRTWDGAENNILMQQNHGKEDHAKVFDDLARYFKDDRYIKFDGKPVVVIYRPAIIDELDALVEIWRSKALEAGFDGIYMIASTAFGFSDPKSIGFDAICEFPPHAVAVGERTHEVELLNHDFEGRIFDYSETVDAFAKIREDVAADKDRPPYFPGVMTGWDNEARKPGRGHVFHGASPMEFHRWLKGAVEWSREHNEPGKQLVFINAWNEWAEGSYIEPDRHHGYAYLHAVSSVRADFTSNREKLKKTAKDLVSAKKTSKSVICAHIFYHDLVEVFAENLEKVRDKQKLDLIISIPDSWKEEQLAEAIKLLNPVKVVVSSNIGRDIWPFLQTVRVANDMGYENACKIHSKKSLHLKGAGIKWRSSLFASLLAPENANKALKALKSKKKIGLIAASESFMQMQGGDDVAMNMLHNLETSRQVCEKLDLKLDEIEEFVAGTMFWFKIEALQKFFDSDIDESFFGAELGAIDGTVAHAFERVFCGLVQASGYKVEKYEFGSELNPYGR